MLGEIDKRVRGMMRVSRRSRRRRYDLVHRRHRWDELVPGGRVLGGHTWNVIRQSCLCRAGVQGVIHVARNAGRRSHVFVGGGHRVRRHCDVGGVFRRRRLAENFI